MKSLFFQGLFTLLPITATIFFVNITYGLVVKWLSPIKQAQPHFLHQFPGSELILVFLFIFMVGVIIRFMLLAPIIHYFERLISKIPFIRTVYSASKTVVEFFNMPENATREKKVVLIEYPRKNCYCLAFLLESTQGTFEQLFQGSGNKQEFVKVFVPSSPAPTTGYFLILPRNEVIETEITFEEAIKTVVSCGLITPESLKQDIDE